MKVNLKKLSETNIVLICGAESFVRRRYLSEVQHSVEADEFDTESFLANERSVDEWVSAAATVPFMSEKRVVLVRHLLRKEELKDSEARELGSLPSSAMLILVADDEANLEDTKASQLNKKWSGWVSKAGGLVLDAASPGQDDVVKALRARATEAGFGLSNSAAKLLAEICGGNLSRAMDEMEKLEAYCNGKSDIVEADIQLVATPSPEWNIFRLVDSVAAGNTARALQQLKSLVTPTSKAEQSAYRNIVSRLARQFRLLYQARTAIDRGFAPSRAPADLVALWPDSPSLAKEQGWLQDKIGTAAGKISTEACLKCLEELSDANACLNGLLPSANAMEAVELLLIRCSAHVRSPKASVR
ncbi:MAG: DNA polymerase III subunit delta [Armatimonadetes bacterium]|nr:DNA polymerase III subunit delta [Armatimonadota bacterium]